MLPFRSLFLIIAICTSFSGYSQQTQLEIPRNIQATYQKGTRAQDGKPGPHYWQNTADYTIQVNFDPQTRKITGAVDIIYENNSPDTLKQIWFKLYPNLYQKGAPRASGINPEDVSEGVQIEKFSYNGNVIAANKLNINNTNMVVPVKALAPKQKGLLSISYSYVLNKGSHTRTGQIDEGAHFVAYFFPRIAVYDDIDGWNRHPYIGSQEFYNDFCNFKVAITVPRHFTVWATGDLKNASQVLQKKYAQRLVQAEKKDGIIYVIDSTDLKRQDITAANATNTWQFEAQNVIDFAFATSNHYVWQSTSLVVDPKTKRRTRVDAVYNNQHKDYHEVIHFACKTVEAMSYTFPKWPFPYAHETIFDGLDQMEYPMMVNDNPVKTREDAITLTDHEIFHTMFPFYLGTNETKYGWMDEGWATIGEWIISSIIDPKLIDDYGIEPYSRTGGTEVDVPINTLSTQQNGTAFFLNSYAKPAMAYLYVKDLLGDELFTKALHHYITLWNGKHPMPFDFFNAMNAGAGRNLNWFWQKWFFETGYPDLAIANFTQIANQGKAIIQMIGNKPLPIDLTITFTDNSTQKIHRNIGVWEKGNKTVEVEFAAAKPVKKIVMGSTYVPDSDKTNNTFPVK